MELICHADRPEEEDTFLLAADLVDQLKRKHEIMRCHWLDAQDYLTTPNR